MSNKKLINQSTSDLFSRYCYHVQDNNIFSFPLIFAMHEKMHGMTPMSFRRLEATQLSTGREEERDETSLHNVSLQFIPVPVFIKNQRTIAKNHFLAIIATTRKRNKSKESCVYKP